MLIGELSRSSGVSTDTIRWYEKIGLLRRDESKRDLNNYRIYDEQALNKLVMIRQSKSFGFTIKEIKEMLDLIDSEELHCDAVSPIIETKLNTIDQKISELQNIRNKLIRLRERCTGDCQDQIKNG